MIKYQLETYKGHWRIVERFHNGTRWHYTSPPVSVSVPAEIKILRANSPHPELVLYNTNNGQILKSTHIDALVQQAT